MAQELSLPKSFGKLPEAFKGIPIVNDALGAGVGSSYAVMGFRGKVWMVKFGGEEVPLEKKLSNNSQRSFYAGHTAATASASFAFLAGLFGP